MNQPKDWMQSINRNWEKSLRSFRSMVSRSFMISHDVEFVAEYADRVGLFFQGNVVTSKPAAEFFAGNSFYTTAANRMARHYFP